MLDVCDFPSLTHIFIPDLITMTSTIVFFTRSLAIILRHLPIWIGNFLDPDQSVPYTILKISEIDSLGSQSLYRFSADVPNWFD